MKLTPDVLKQMIKEAIRTEFPLDADSPDPELAPKMEAVSKAMDQMILMEMDEMISEIGNIVVTMNPNEKLETLVNHGMGILMKSGLILPSRQKYSEIIKDMESEYEQNMRDQDEFYDNEKGSYSQQELPMSERKKRKKQ